MSWLSLFIGIVVGGIVGFLAARYTFKKQLQKKTPYN